MPQILIFVFGVIVGGAAGFYWARKISFPFRRGKDRDEKNEVQGGKKGGLIAEQAEEKRANKDKILAYLLNRQEISNDDIEKLLVVSNATAERYLDELEKEGKLAQVGKTGRSVYYKKA